MIPRYTRPELVELWSDRHRYETWLRVELAACAGDGGGGHGAGRDRRRGAREGGRQARSRRASSSTRSAPRHDVIAFLTHVEELAGEPARWLHLGHDVVRRARRVARASSWSRRADRDPGRHRPAARRLPPARRGAPRDADDRPLARHPRRADHRRAGVRRLLRRARARDARALVAARDGDRRRQDRRRGRHLRQPRSRRSRARRSARSACGPRPCRRRSSRAIATPRSSRRWRGSAPRSSGSRSTSATGSAPRSARRGGVRQGAEGLVGDAAQEEPDPVARTCAARAPAPRRTRAPALEDVALWHERDISHSSVERVIGPDATGLADFMVRRAAGAGRRPGRQRRAHAREPGAHRAACSSARR